MRKLILLASIIGSIAISGAKAQFVDIPDPLFRNFLQLNYPACMNTQGQLDTTCSAILSQGGIILDGTAGNCMRDLTGLQYFKNLTFLWLFNQSCIETMPVLNSLKRILAPYSPLKLSWLPNGLKTFSISNQDPATTNWLPPFINDNGHLPDSLVTLDCKYQFAMLPTGGFPPLPQGLQDLDLTSVQPLAIDSLPALPASLKRLNITNLELVNFPALPSSLTYLNWSSDFVRVGIPLPALPPQLDTFELFGRMIKQLPAMPASLKYFSCWGEPDSTTTIPVMPNGLKTFRYIGARSLHSFPPFPNSITEIECMDVYLDNLPALPTSLKRLVFNNDTLLTSLPALPAGLQYLECNTNRLTSLPPFPSSLMYLKCNWNRLASLPPFNDGLITALCNGNRIREIQRLPNTIERLEIASNNIFCLPFIPQTPYVTTIIADPTIKCISTVNTRLQYYQSVGGTPVGVTPKLCTPTNNQEHCASYPVIKGYIFYDQNNNGIKDPGEPVKKDVRVTLNSRYNNFTFTDKRGYYELQADSLGSYTVTPQLWSVFFDFQPANASFTFSRYDTVANQDFIIRPNNTLDSVEINITYLNRLRPGFPVTCNVTYENTGSSTLIAPVVTIHYDDTRLVYESSSVPLSQVANTLVFNPGDMQPFDQGSFTATFRLKTTVALGDSVNTTATIAANSKVAASIARDIVRGSFDPNDKNATPQLSPLQVANGEYIDYTIRFQNTGTDTAFNVVISDTLNSDLQVNTLTMLASSHTCKTTVQGNIVFFEFLDILLPDSNINEPLSHGFVSFRIKPQTTVVPNTTIPNKAAIYFDYNAPVITNTAGTLIKNFIVVPVRLVSFSAVPQTGNATTLYWRTANEINAKEFVVERGSDGFKFNSITTIAAKGKTTNDYYAAVADVNTGIIFYRLKIVDDDGTFSYSPIIKIDKRKNATGFSVLTNPVKDFIVISTTDKSLNNTQASIINMQGAVVKSFIVKEGSQTVEVRGLPNGVYYLRTVNGSQKILVR